MFTFCLPFVGCFGGLLLYFSTGLPSHKVWILKGLLLGLSAGLAVDLTFALLNWLSGKPVKQVRCQPASPDTQPPTKVT